MYKKRGKMHLRDNSHHREISTKCFSTSENPQKRGNNHRTKKWNKNNDTNIKQENIQHYRTSETPGGIKGCNQLTFSSLV